MSELYLSYNGEDGTQLRVPVGKTPFSIGRHSSNDLSITNSRLSRIHVQITRDGGGFWIVDMGSSNGTRLNGDELIDPAALFDGDLILLGGDVEISVELTGAGAYDLSESKPGAEQSNGPPAGSHPASRPAGEGDFDYGKILVIGSLIGIFVLFVIGGAILAIRALSVPAAADRDDNIVSTRDIGDDDFPEKKPEPEKSNAPSNSETPLASNSDGDSTPAPVDQSDGPQVPASTESNAKLERAAVGFLRRIARKDPSPVLTTRQLEVVKTKISQVKGSGALPGNINNARQNSSSLLALARSKNLKPQFLANAALTQLGSNQGNVVETAQKMLDVLDKLNIQIGDERADESLVAIAAYQQGVAGEFLQMRNTMERLGGQNPSVSSRQIRTIWFLYDKGKISNAEFEFALRFLAIGTITQNPGEFGVNAEALILE